MNRTLTAALLFLAGLSACKKETPVAPPPPPQQVAAPTPPPIAPGMEAENPAEKEGRP